MTAVRPAAAAGETASGYSDVLRDGGASQKVLSAQPSFWIGIQINSEARMPIAYRGMTFATRVA
jgi:hypothetical protein